MRSMSLLFLSALISIVANQGTVNGQEEIVCIVERITDGDTIRCGKVTRLLMIDAPESGQESHGDPVCT
jgi:endonuclease YncB( thermonuclease family)